MLELVATCDHCRLVTRCVTKAYATVDAPSGWATIGDDHDAIHLVLCSACFAVAQAAKEYPQEGNDA